MELAGRVFLHCRALLACGAFVLSLTTCSPAAAQDAEVAEPTDAAGLHELYYGAHLPHDRATMRKLERAEELLSRERYSEALPLLDELLSADQDVFSEIPRSESGSPVGLKERAGKLLADLPPAGREAYLLLFEATANRQAKAALEKHHQAELERVAVRFENTPAGEEAALILAQMAADSGDFATADRIVERLLTLPAARQRWGDYLHLRAAEYQSRLGNRAAAEQHLASSSLRGEEAAKLRNLLAASPPIPRRDSEGDRNATAPAGTPHLWERWQARVVVDRRLEDQLHARRDRRRDSLTSTPLLPSAIAVGDLVVARGLNNLVAIDWNTGKRVWETRPEADAWIEASDGQYDGFGEDSYGRGRLHPLLLRLWKDAVYASLSSDGERVYALRDLEYATNSYSTRWGMMPGFADGADRASKLTNRLAAYRVDAEGKLAWEIDGAKSNHALSGAFFLGAPLAVSTSLFVMAEIDSGIYLLELNPQDGSLLWKQPLASLERGIDQDTGRRLAGATLSYRNGVLVCPTGAGVVIAVKPQDRALLWAFRVPVRKGLLDQQEDLLQRRAYGSWRQTNEQWLETRAVLSDDLVVLTLPESPDLYCLKLTTGEVAWTRPREDGMYLAGVTESQAIVVGKREVIAAGLSDGTPQWRRPLPEGLSPSGRGVLCGDELCLPLEKGHLAIVSLHDGTQAELLKTHAGQALGNFLAHRGTILSQSLAHVDRFDRRQELQREVSERLAADARDASALRLAGELAESKGDAIAALGLFKQAYAADAADPLIRERVVDAALAAVNRDFPTHRNDLKLLESLADDPPLRLEVLRLKVDGLAVQKELREAFECLLQIYALAINYDETIAETAFGGSRLDRWFAGAISRIWQASDTETRGWIGQRMASLKANLPPTPAIVELAGKVRFARYFGGLPGQEQILLELAEAHYSAGQRREAELIWLQLLVRDDDQLAAEAQRRFARTLQPEVLETLPQTGPMAASETLTPARWPAVQIAAEIDRKRRSRGARGLRSDEEGQSYLPIRFQSTLLEQFGPANFALNANGGEIVAWDREGDVIARGEVGVGRDQSQPNSRDVNNNGRMGHFVYLAQGERSLAFDVFATNTSDNLQMWSRVGGWNQRRTPVSRGGANPSFAPSEATLLLVSPAGIVLHSRDAIYCVHPLTGELEWFRRSTNNRPVAFGDSEHIYLASDDRTTGQVLSIADGTELGSWQPPKGAWIASVGRRLATEQASKNGLLIQVVDLASGGIELELSLPLGTKSKSFAPGWLALLAPSGRLEMINLNSGKIAYSQKLRAEPNLVSLDVVADQNQLYVLVNTLSDADQSLAGFFAPPGESLTTGKLYAIDASTGVVLWPQPAVVAGRVVLPLQPPSSPALLLASFRSPSESESNESVAELLAIDKATGQSIFRSDRLNHSPKDSIVVHLDRRPELTLLVDSRQWGIRLSPQSSSRPPEPVAHDDVESIGALGKDGLWGVGRQLGRVLDEVFRGGPE